MNEKTNNTEKEQTFNEFDITNEKRETEELTLERLEEGNCIGLRTNVGTIEGVMTGTDEHKEKARSYSGAAKGMLKIDGCWRKFSVSSYSNRVNINRDFKDSRIVKISKNVKYRATYKVDSSLNIDEDDLTVIDGIGEKRNDFETIRKALEYETDDTYTEWCRGNNSLPFGTKSKIEQRIKFVNEPQKVEEEELGEEIERI